MIAQNVECAVHGGISLLSASFHARSSRIKPDAAMLALAKRCVARGVLGGSEQPLEGLVISIVKKNNKMPIDKAFGFDNNQAQVAFEYPTAGSLLCNFAYQSMKGVVGALVYGRQSSYFAKVFA